MSSFQFKISSGGSLDKVIFDMKMHEDQPTPKAILAMEKVWAEMFADTQVLTHVITGSLKESGTTATDVDENGWTGTISYGGPSTGPNDPVTYAIYEKARGGDHDFFRTLPGYTEKMSEAVKEAFK